MKVLLLGPMDSPLQTMLEELGEEVEATSASLTPGFVDAVRPEFVVSYNYWPIIKKWALERFTGKIINLHISLLPWNRGLAPNFWSHFENTPSGVTIHHIDEGIDTGDVIAQREVIFDRSPRSAETLATSYYKLHEEIRQLFQEHWPEISAGLSSRRPQTAGGTYHSKADFTRLRERLPELDRLLSEQGSQLPLSEIIRLSRKQ